MQNQPALEISALRKTYENGVEALKGVSLSVQPGDFFALLGPNGAGKSTLIGVVSSLVNSSSGEVNVFGINLQKQRSEAMRQIGLVPQEINFNMFEKPFDICVNYAGFYGMDRKTARKYIVAAALPSQMRAPRDWRTREDPFAEHREEIEALLRDTPELEAKTIFELLTVKHPDRFAPGQLRTLQRMIRAWRAAQGAADARV